MSQDTDTSVKDLKYLIDLLGPEEAARLTRPLTAEESAIVDEILAKHGGDPVAALGVEHYPEDVKAEMRRVMSA